MATTLHQRTSTANLVTASAQPQHRSAVTAQGGEEALYGEPERFTDSNLAEFAIAIMGDLHLQPDQMHLFHAAREQLTTALASPEQSPGRTSQAGEAVVQSLPAGARVVQLGDLGGYTCQPGSMACFHTGRQFLDGFPVPAALVVGNHDLEGGEFETDGDNMAAWQQVFRQRHYWAAQLGPVLCIGLSTTRFRSNEFSAHEVHIDDEQLAWFEAQLVAAGDQPVVVFTHAPPMGCGLKVIQEVHVKNRCAWLNHSSNPEVFLQLVQRYANVRLWFSGHFHLSHNYADSISVVGQCAFVQTGVIGECNRDGLRQSRFLRGDTSGFRLYTMDHANGQLRLDLEAGWHDATPPQPILPADERLCNPEDGWLCSQVDCGVSLASALPGAQAQNGSSASNGAEHAGAQSATSSAAGRNGTPASQSSQSGPATPPASPQPVSMRPSPNDRSRTQWYPAGPACMLALQGGMLVEYDTRSMAMVGVVIMHVGSEESIALVDSQGRILDSTSMSEDGSSAVAVEQRSPTDELVRRVNRNERGTFFAIFQQNKWRLRKEQERQAALVS